ncbi:MAG: hypothetical protein AB1640_12685 [bacterium]
MRSWIERKLAWAAALLSGCVALTALLSPITATAQTEAPPALAARDLLPAELLSGTDFTVDQSVPTHSGRLGGAAA